MWLTLGLWNWEEKAITQTIKYKQFSLINQRKKITMTPSCHFAKRETMEINVLSVIVLFGLSSFG